MSSIIAQRNTKRNIVNAIMLGVMWSIPVTVVEMICTWWGHSPSSQPLKVWWLRSGVDSFALHFNTRCVDPLKGSSSWPWKPRAQSLEGFSRVCHHTKVVDYVDWSFEGTHICKETIDSKYWSLGQTCWEACFQFCQCQRLLMWLALSEANLPLQNLWWLGGSAKELRAWHQT